MSKTSQRIAVTMLLIGLVGGAWWLIDRQSSPVAQFDERRLLRLKLEVANQGNAAVNDAKMSLYAPQTNLSNQQLIEFRSKHEHQTQTTNTGNQLAVVSLGVIPPFGHKTVEFTAELGMATAPNTKPLSKDEHTKLTQAGPLIDHDQNSIIKLADRLRADDDAVSVAAISEWVNSNIEFGGYIAQDLSASHVLKSRSADSSGFAYLTVALARAMGLPARAVGGFVATQNKVVSASEYHNWTEVYFDRAWHPVDPQKSAQLEVAQNYIVLRIINEDEITFARNGHEFVSVSKGLTIR